MHINRNNNRHRRIQIPRSNSRNIWIYSRIITQRSKCIRNISKSARNKNKSKFEVNAKTINRIEFLENGKVTFTYITNQDEKEVNAEPGDHEGLVEVGRDVEGVEVSVFIRQKDNEDKYKVSMRSSNYVNVSDICYIFGGGGHPKAAGCLIQGNIEQVKEKIMKEIKKY